MNAGSVERATENVVNVNTTNKRRNQMVEKTLKVCRNCGNIYGCINDGEVSECGNCKQISERHSRCFDDRVSDRNGKCLDCEIRETFIIF